MADPDPDDKQQSGRVEAAFQSPGPPDPGPLKGAVRHDIGASRGCQREILPWGERWGFNNPRTATNGLRPIVPPGAAC